MKAIVITGDREELIPYLEDVKAVQLKDALFALRGLRYDMVFVTPSANVHFQTQRTRYADTINAMLCCLVSTYSSQVSPRVVTLSQQQVKSFGSVTYHYQQGETHE